jgi:signal recognition particle GTPase
MSLTEDLSEAERNLQAEGKVPFFKFVLTGGPCAGKTTALARIYSYLRERGFEVITCPEAFTILASNGMSLDFFLQKEWTL